MNSLLAQNSIVKDGAPSISILFETEHFSSNSADIWLSKKIFKETAIWYDI